MRLRCPRCNTWKDESKFNISKTQATGRQSYCKDCHKVYKTENRRNASLKYLYGLTQKEIDELATNCGICDSKKNLCVDHNHHFGYVRGVLCKSCNQGLGFFKEDIDLMKKAIEYLERA